MAFPSYKVVGMKKVSRPYTEAVEAEHFSSSSTQWKMTMWLCLTLGKTGKINLVEEEVENDLGKI